MRITTVLGDRAHGQRHGTGDGGGGGLASGGVGHVFAAGRLHSNRGNVQSRPELAAFVAAADRYRDGRDQRGGVTREYSQDRHLRPESSVHGDGGADYRRFVLVVESRHVRFVLRRF